MKKIPNIFMYALGALIVIGFFCAMIFILLNNKAGEYTAMITDGFSAIKYGFFTMIGYYWGTSKSSSDKNDIINNIKNLSDKTVE